MAYWLALKLKSTLFETHEIIVHIWYTINEASYEIAIL